MRFDRFAMTMMMAAALTACGGDEEGPIEGGHGAVADAILVDETGAELTQPIVLTAGETMRVEVVFLDEHGAEVHGLLPGHDSSLEFTPATIATATADFDGGFFFDVEVTGTAGDEGAVGLGYGHDGHIEQVFGPLDVVVE